MPEMRCNGMQWQCVIHSTSRRLQLSNISHRSRTSSHYIKATTTFYIASFHIESNATSGIIIPNHTIPRHAIIPHHIVHFISHQHLLQHTSILQFYFKSHHIGHIMHHTTDISHCTPTLLMYSTPVSDHTIYWPHLCIAPPHLAHNIAPHITCSTSCIIPPHLTVITPNSTSHYLCFT